MEFVFFRIKGHSGGRRLLRTKFNAGACLLVLATAALLAGCAPDVAQQAVNECGMVNASDCLIASVERQCRSQYPTDALSEHACEEKQQDRLQRWPVTLEQMLAQDLAVKQQTTNMTVQGLRDGSLDASEVEPLLDNGTNEPTVPEVPS